MNRKVHVKDLSSVDCCTELTIRKVIVMIMVIIMLVNSEDEIDADKRLRKRVVIGVDAAGVDGNVDVVVMMTDDNNCGNEINDIGDGGGKMLR